VRARTHKHLVKAWVANSPVFPVHVLFIIFPLNSRLYYRTGWCRRFQVLLCLWRHMIPTMFQKSDQNLNY